MKTTTVTRRLARGFTLIEFLGVLLLIGLAGAVIAGLLGSGGSGSSAETEATTATNLFSTMRGFKQAGSYGAAGTDLSLVMIRKDQVPSSYSVAGNAISNGYDGAVTFVSAGTTATMTENNYPSATCIAVVHKVSMLGHTQIKVNGTDLGQGTIEDSAAAAACSLDGDANTVAITSL